MLDRTPVNNLDERRQLIIIEGRRMGENEKMKGAFGQVGNLQIELSGDATQFVVDDWS